MPRGPGHRGRADVRVDSPSDRRLTSPTQCPPADHNLMETRTPPPIDRADLARALFEESGDALFLIDPQSDTFLDANPVAQRLSGFSRDELRTMSASYLF